MLPRANGVWEKQLETIPLATLRLIFRRAAPKELFTPAILKNKQALIDGCLRLPYDSPARDALNDAITSRAREKAERVARSKTKKATKKAETALRRLARAEVTAAMFHESHGEPGSFMETPTPSAVTGCLAFVHLMSD
jgi:hypothetical protein